MANRDEKDAVLAKVDAGRKFLAEATNLQEVNHAIAIGHAAAVYAKRVKAGQDASNSANEFVLRAERRLGELLKTQPRQPAHRPNNCSDSEHLPKLSDAGIDRKLSSRAQCLASASDSDFEAKIAAGKNGYLNRNRVANELREERQSKDRSAKRREAAAGGLEINSRIIIGDFRQHADSVADGSLSLIFTDPPYDRAAAQLFPGLGEFAARKLAQGGSLVVYVGQINLFEAGMALSQHLRYWWTICCLHSGPATLMREYGIRAGWKPVLWFVKGTRDDKKDIVSDITSGGREKDRHEWQQAESEAAYWIEHLCPTDGMVCDPFLGGGTTAIAAAKLNRKWIGFEINSETAKVANARII